MSSRGRGRNGGGFNERFRGVLQRHRQDPSMTKLSPKLLSSPVPEGVPTVRPCTGRTFPESEDY